MCTRCSFTVCFAAVTHSGGLLVAWVKSRKKIGPSGQSVPQLVHDSAFISPVWTTCCSVIIHHSRHSSRSQHLSIIFSIFRVLYLSLSFTFCLLCQLSPSLGVSLKWWLMTLLDWHWSCMFLQCTWELQIIFHITIFWEKQMCCLENTVAELVPDVALLWYLWQRRCLTSVSQNVKTHL